MKCLQCESERIAENVRAIDHGDHLATTHPLSLQTQTNPEAMIFKGSLEYPMRANVCADCGFVMLSVGTKDAENIYRRTHAS